MQRDVARVGKTSGLCERIGRYIALAEAEVHGDGDSLRLVRDDALLNRLRAEHVRRVDQQRVVGGERGGWHVIPVEGRAQQRAIRLPVVGRVRVELAMRGHTRSAYVEVHAEGSVAEHRDLLVAPVVRLLNDRLHAPHRVADADAVEARQRWQASD